MNQDVNKLWELQTVLSQLGERERQLNSKPESFASLDREWQAANEEMTRLEGAIESLTKERRRADGELADHQELLKKYQGQLMQVKNQQQYAAAWKEIDATRKQVKELEDADLKIMGDIETLQKDLEDRRTGSVDLKAKWDEAYAAWQSSLGGLRSEADQLRKKAEAIEATLAPRLKAEFHKIFGQRQGVAVSRIMSDSCNSCRTRIRPALMQQVKRGELVHCEGCHRILYMERPAS